MSWIPGKFWKHHNFLVAIILTGMICVLLPSIASADQNTKRINEIKSAFVLNIARFVTWPDEIFNGDKKAGLKLCYFRSKVFGDGLETIKGKTVSGRQIKVLQLEQLSSTNHCQIILVSRSELDDFSKQVQPDLMHAVLTITDNTNDTTNIKGPLPKGILINLIRKGTRIGFEIDLFRSREAGLKMSSKLLKHAHIVGEGS